MTSWQKCSADRGIWLVKVFVGNYSADKSVQVSVRLAKVLLMAMASPLGSMAPMKGERMGRREKVSA